MRMVRQSFLLGSYNVLAHSGVITGIIDWNLALYGDPLYDVANVLFWNERKLQPLIFALKERYLTETLNRKKVFCYMLRIGLDEVYKTVALNHIGLDVSWVVQRIDELCRNEI